MSIALVATIIYGVIVYILNGIALMTMAKKLSIKNGYFAWIPLLKYYLMGEIAYGERSSKKWNLVIFLMLTWFNPIESIATLIFSIVYFIACYKIFEKFSDKANIMIIFSVLSLSLLTPFFIFAIRNNTDINTVLNDDIIA